MAVAGDPKERSGIILAKNELAKRFGVQTAETIWQARRKCPQLVLAPPHYHRYVEVSQQVNAVYQQYTDQVEPFGIDESFLDVTGSLRYFRATPRQLGDEIRERVKREIGITISVGVSYNKVFAKIGSDMKKPDATTEITRENFRELVWPLPVRDMLFVGHASGEVLARHYIQTIGDIARRSRTEMAQLLGRSGEALWAHVHGLDTDRVRAFQEQEPLKSIGNGMTFRRDLTCDAEIRAGLIALSDEVAARLRKARQQCKTVQVVIKNPLMQTICRQVALPLPTHLHRELADAAIALVHAHWPVQRDGRCAPIRALTVTAMNLSADGEVCRQLSLFDLNAEGGLVDSHRDRQERLETAMADMRARFGNGCVSMGFVDREELGIHILQPRGHKPLPPPGTFTAFGLNATP